MTSPMLYADKLTPRKSIISTQRPCPWPHSWCWCYSPNPSWPGPQRTPRLPDPTATQQSPTTPGTVCLPAAPWPLRAQEGHRRRDGRKDANSGRWWAVTSHGLPAYVRTSNSQAVTHSISRDSHEAGNGGFKVAGRLWCNSCHCHTPRSPGAPTSCTCSGCGGRRQRKHLVSGSDSLWVDKTFPGKDTGTPRMVPATCQVAMGPSRALVELRNRGAGWAGGPQARAWEALEGWREASLLGNKLVSQAKKGNVASLLPDQPWGDVSAKGEGDLPPPSILVSLGPCCLPLPHLLPLAPAGDWPARSEV